MGTDTNGARGFVDVFRQELKSIRRRRLVAGDSCADVKDISDSLVGVALSGGGVRSATFCLGLLQAMRSMQLLHKVDYLSTVSGGGYVGAWWSAWLARNRINLRRTGTSPLFRLDEIKDLHRLAQRLCSSDDPLCTHMLASRPAMTNLAGKLLETDSAICNKEEVSEQLVDELNCLVGYDGQEACREILKWALEVEDQRLKECLILDRELIQSIGELYCKREYKFLESARPKTHEKLAAPGFQVSDLTFATKLDLLKGLAAKIGGPGPLVDDPDPTAPIDESDLRWLNRAFLEAAFPGEIGRDIFPPPERTELERIPDESGSSETRSAGRDPIHHLRLYANYLTPRKGILSGDTWRVVTVVLRNLGISWSILLPALVALVLFGQLYFVVQTNPVGTFINPNPKNTLPPTHENYKGLEVLTLLEEQEATNLDSVGIHRLGKQLKFTERLADLKQELENRDKTDKEKELLKTLERFNGQGLKRYLAERKDPQLTVLKEILKNLRKADQGILETLNSWQMNEAARSQAVRNKKADDEEKRRDTKERAREHAMKARLVSVAWGLAPFAFWILILGLRYLWLTLEPEQDKRSERAVIGLSVIVAVISVVCLFNVYTSSKKGIQKPKAEAKAEPKAEEITNTDRANQSSDSDSDKTSERPSTGTRLLALERRLFLNTLVSAKDLLQTGGVFARKWWRVILEFLIVTGMVIYFMYFSGSKDRLVSRGHRRWEQLRNRVNLVQTKLVIWFALTAAVLMVSGFGHELFNENSYRLVNDALATTVSAIALAAAIAGVIAIIYWVRPKGGGDRRELTAKSRIIRLTMAATPTLVIVVLAVGIAWIGHYVLVRIHDAIKPETYGQWRTGPLLPVAYLTIGAYCGVFISLIYAIFETKELSARRVRAFIACASVTALAICLTLHACQLIYEKQPKPYWLLSAFLCAIPFCAAVLFPRFYKRRDTTDGAAKVLGSDRRAPALIAFSLAILIFYVVFSFVPYKEGPDAGIDRKPAMVERDDPDSRDPDGRYARSLFGLIATAATFIIGLGWMADPNAYSMHIFYKVRLVRAYLGASNYKRGEEHREITEPDSNDDVLLKKLKNCEKGAPYHLINTTLNLAAGRDLATAQRSADSFLLSQQFSGSSRTSFRETSEYMNGGLSLGAAAAVSGAAASPNMGSRTPTAALAMLMTMLNVRLGYWVSTPNRHTWRSSRARLWPFYLFREFLSRTNDVSHYCYLTDGGHFDNTGAYSLVQRGCRCIILADCGADPRLSYSDLGDLIRRCRIDFGAEIDRLDLRPPEKGTKKDIHYQEGMITYNSEYIKKLRRLDRKPTPHELTGKIILIKPAIPEGENNLPDVRQYQIANRIFPQQSTLDQWFDEAQFESYRRLGFSCATSALRKLCEELVPKHSPNDSTRGNS